MTSKRLGWLATVGGVSFALSDFVFSWNPLAAAPYLAHRAEPVFRAVPAFAVGFIAEAINGWIAALSFSAVQGALGGSLWRRGAIFGAMMWGFWVVSGTFSSFVWLNIPASLAATNVLFGLPKCLVIGCTMAWAWHKSESA